jgi:hypothetical protein
MLPDNPREAGAEQQATALAERLPGAACSGSSAEASTGTGPPLTRRARHRAAAHAQPDRSAAAAPAYDVRTRQPGQKFLAREGRRRLEVGRTGGLRSDASGFSMRRPLSGPLSGSWSRSRSCGPARRQDFGMPERRPAAWRKPAYPCPPPGRSPVRPRGRTATMPHVIALGSVCDVRAPNIVMRDGGNRSRVAKSAGKGSVIPDSDH